MRFRSIYSKLLNKLHVAEILEIVEYQVVKYLRSDVLKIIRQTHPPLAR
jgi:hypothetical protein